MGSILDGRDENTKLLRKQISIEADIINLDTLLRFIMAPSSPELEKHPIDFYLINYGNFSRELLFRLSKEKSVKEVIIQLAARFYHKDLLQGLARYKENGLLSEFEKSIRTYAVRWLSRLPRTNPLGVGVPMGYVALKRNEIRNIRWIANGLYSGFNSQYIKDNLERIK